MWYSAVPFLQPLMEFRSQYTVIYKFIQVSPSSDIIVYVVMCVGPYYVHCLISSKKYKYTHIRH